ncbi:MarR family winged helix-turn-helix transcriptional regulator [Luteipulveratus sp. YIM 133132]|uniref:MarR family winged helix-turn-helix transcriptional regulator n=1 Tax=Luteipulveratus flavus TaxID=3031728 RepID=UPI0023AEC771|nr:MarR family winged helix-turn-helix transcriptional regulator [Luteipulveratus sp. YIM 133132]MDE9366257.1 MarR family winged helix-turn-helix transcriptional regulator [Luteipulveratus sp. YIM 133132]
MTPRKKAPAPSERERYEAEVAAYVAAGGSEDVQRVITAVHGLHRRLSQWYSQSLTDVGLTGGEWGVISQLATAPRGTVMTPTQLAGALSVAPSSMTHRLDKMTERGLVDRTPDQEKRTRVLVTLTEQGWQTFQQVIKDSDVVESDVLERLSSAQRVQLAELLEQAIAGVDDALST